MDKAKEIYEAVRYLTEYHHSDAYLDYVADDHTNKDFLECDGWPCKLLREFFKIP